MAALGGSGTSERKFMQAPDVVPFDDNYDAILIGSGDRENPLDVTIQNHFFMVKDAHPVNALPTTPLEMADLYNATTTYAVPSNATGWYFALATGEKVVTGATTLNGATFFSTNRPRVDVADGHVMHRGPRGGSRLRGELPYFRPGRDSMSAAPDRRGPLRSPCRRWACRPRQSA